MRKWISHIITGVLLVSLLGALVMFVATTARQHAAYTNTAQTSENPTATASAIACPRLWFKSPNPTVVAYCFASIQQTRVALGQTDYAQALLNPTVPWPPTEPISSPTPPGYDPSIPTVQPVDLWPDSPMNLRGGNSSWLIGKISSSSPLEYYEVYAIARPPGTNDNASLATTIVEGSEADFALYDRISIAPQAVGVITITGVLGPTTSPHGLRGTLLFDTSSGITGTFNLETQAWSFGPNGTPLPTATPRPTLTPRPTRTPTVPPTAAPTDDPYPAPADLTPPDATPNEVAPTDPAASDVTPTTLAPPLAAMPYSVLVPVVIKSPIP